MAIDKWESPLSSIQIELSQTVVEGSEHAQMLFQFYSSVRSFQFSEQLNDHQIQLNTC